MSVHSLKGVKTHKTQLTTQLGEALSKIQGKLGGRQVSSVKGQPSPLNNQKTNQAHSKVSGWPASSKRTGEPRLLIGQRPTGNKSLAQQVLATPKQLKSASKPIIGEARQTVQSVGSKLESSKEKILDQLKPSVSGEHSPDVQKATAYRVDVHLANDQAREYHTVLRNTLVNYLGCTEDEARALCNQAADIDQKMQALETKKAQGDTNLEQDRKVLSQLKVSFFQELQDRATVPYLNAIGTEQEKALETIYEDAQSGRIFILSGMHDDLLAQSLEKAGGMRFLGSELRQAILQEQQQRQVG